MFQLSIRNIVNLATVLVKSLAFWGIICVSAQANSRPTNQTIPHSDLNPEQIPGSIIVKSFEIIGNQVISNSVLDALFESYLLRPISFVELLEIQQKITQLLIDRGYLTSGAYIPPQTIKDRTVKIEIIEGRVEDIKIFGLQHLRPEYIRSRLERATKPPLNQENLLNALQLLQLDPRIDKISAELSSGIDPGESLLNIQVEEANTFSARLTYDNYQAVSVGSQSRELLLADDNVLGFGDRLEVDYINTPSSDSLGGLSYTVPLSAKDNEFRALYSYSNSLIISEPFEELELSSRSSYFEASYRHPLFRTSQKEIALGFSLTHQDTQLFLMDIGFPTLARGTDIEGVTKISALRFSQEYSKRSDRYVFALNSQFSIGLDLFDATINADNIPDSQFLVWRGQAQYIRQLGKKTNLFLRGDVQLADRPLVSLEQFRAGGALSVRGYRRDRTLGDNGLFLSVELRNSIWQTAEGESSLELNPFVDFGRVWNNDDLAIENNTLAAVGLGLQLSLDNIFTARIDWGIPLVTDKGFQSNSLQDNGVYFSLQLQPFK
ncbi:MAG: ShlB/FhaC/HecB family hemolysin secretion/activation protein [Cyanobacteria bacterium J06600_6]